MYLPSWPDGSDGVRNELESSFVVSFSGGRRDAAGSTAQQSAGLTVSLIIGAAWIIGADSTVAGEAAKIDVESGAAARLPPGAE